MAAGVRVGGRLLPGDLGPFRVTLLPAEGAGTEPGGAGLFIVWIVCGMSFVKRDRLGGILLEAIG